MIVMKFGGTSVQDAQAIRRVISIVKTRLKDSPLVVVSAFARVTRLLVEMAEEAQAQHTSEVKDLMDKLRERHEGVCADLLGGNPDLLKETSSLVGAVCDSLEDFVAGVCKIGELSPRSRARIVSTGEVLSSIIVNAAMNENGIVSHWADARTLIITDDNYMSARPDMTLTKANIRRVVPGIMKGADVVLTQGFVASTTAGATSVLGFEGSDYSAALFGMALRADRVEIWTDVDGIRTADPRVVPQTQRLERISYEEAAEMAYLGARVLHPLTIEPARGKNIPIYVLNTMNPEGEGSAVVMGEGIPDGPKSVAFRDEIDFLVIESSQIVGVKDMLSRVFRILDDCRVAVSLVSASESKVSLTIPAGQLHTAEAVEQISEIYSTTLYKDKAQVSVTGRNVVYHQGLTSGVLDIAGTVYMVSVGANLMSLSFVVDREKIREIICGLHDMLFKTE